MQEFSLNLEQIGDLTFTQFIIMLEELARQSEEMNKETKSDGAATGGDEMKTINTPEQRAAFIRQQHAMGVGRPGK